mmetsp:Transcript_5098/g.10784  ORF Transcript_5098/g.10784 Transcript_5098/m.10784 type:complete len:219 (+) Transcript_5098:1175-1831(+)
MYFPPSRSPLPPFPSPPPFSGSFSSVSHPPHSTSSHLLHLRSPQPPSRSPFSSSPFLLSSSPRKHSPPTPPSSPPYSPQPQPSQPDSSAPRPPRSHPFSPPPPHFHQLYSAHSRSCSSRSSSPTNSNSMHLSWSLRFEEMTHCRQFRSAYVEFQSVRAPRSYLDLDRTITRSVYRRRFLQRALCQVLGSGNPCLPLFQEAAHFALALVAERTGQQMGL